MFRINSIRKQPDHGSPLKVSLLVVGYAVIHSLLASRPAKELVERTCGTRVRNGLYRPAYIVQAGLTTAWAIWKFLQFPDRELYRIPRPWTWPLRMVRIAAVTLLVSGLHTVRIYRVLGLPQLVGYLKGGTPDPEPEAQGPALAPDGDIDARGPFRAIRHPDNLPIIVLMWSFSRMTVNRLMLAILSTVYAIFGSWHEDARMRARYGRAFEDYTRRVPILIPRAKRLPRSVSHPGCG